MVINGIFFSQGELWLIGVAGTLILFISGNRLTLWNNRRNAIRAYVYTYKSAFADCLSAIATNTFALDTFTRDLVLHKAAVDAIRPHLPECYQRKLQEAWDNYCGEGTGVFPDCGGWVASASAMYFGGSKTMFNEFKDTFRALYSCLDGLL